MYDKIISKYKNYSGEKNEISDHDGNFIYFII